MPEVLITIVLMGIVLAIASATWFGIVESRAVDSATNQLASDLRLAHSSAANRLVSYQVVLTANSSTYQIGPSGSLRTRTLPDNTKAGTTVTIAFCPGGSAEMPPSSPTPCPGGSAGSLGSPSTIVVSANDGNPSHNIQITPATSRVRID